MARSVLIYLALLFEICTADGDWATQTFKTELFSAPQLSAIKYGETAPGLLVMDPTGISSNTTAPMIFHEDGQMIWRTEFEEYSHNTDIQELNGQPVLTYWTGQKNAAYGCGWGGVDILDNTYTKLHRVCGDKLDVNPLMHLNQPCKLDSHESRITSRGTILATVRSVTPADLSSVGGPKDGWVLDSLFYELDVATEKVLLRWSTYEHRDQFPVFRLSEYPLAKAGGGSFGNTRELPWDFAHMNSIAEVPSPGDGFIVSCRYLFSAIKLDKSGNVEWYLKGSDGGQFALPSSGNFSYQHDIIPSEVTPFTMNLHMFDNGNNEYTHPQMPSSGLLLHLNLVNKTVTTLQRFSPLNVTSSTHTGSYQALGWEEHVLIDYGHPPILNEFDSNGKLVWEASVGDLQAGTYRAYKRFWKGFPKTNPKAAAQHAGSSTNVWASWNGATEVERWAIYGRRQANDSMKFIDEAPKVGFETLVTLNGQYSQVQAQAVLGNGTAIGQSEMTEVQRATSAAASLLTSRSSMLALVVATIVAAMLLELG